MLLELLAGGEKAVGHRDEQLGEWKARASKEGKGMRKGAVCVWGLVL